MENAIFRRHELKYLVTEAQRAALEERFHTVNRGTGVSFAVPLTSVIGKLSYGFLSNEQRMLKGET